MSNTKESPGAALSELWLFFECYESHLAAQHMTSANANGPPSLPIQDQELERFFSDLDFRIGIQQATKRRLDRQVATDFDVFKFIAPDENKLSDILALLLDPNGTRGQQELFLSLFLKRLGVTPTAALTCAKVAREALTHNIKKHLRRIDILVTLGNFGLALENKIDSPEQQDQLGDYNEHLQGTCAADYVLVFLTPDGRLPESLAPAKVRDLVTNKCLFCLGYHKQILPWLADCRSQCESDKVRHFLADLMTYIGTRIAIEAEAQPI